MCLMLLIKQKAIVSVRFNLSIAETHDHQLLMSRIERSHLPVELKNFALSYFVYEVVGLNNTCFHGGVSKVTAEVRAPSHEVASYLHMVMNFYMVMTDSEVDLFSR